MTDNTEALPPLPEHTMDMHMIAIPMRCRDDAKRYAESYARAALAQRQQVPAEWTMRLDTDAAETLKQTIGDDDTVSEITLSLCDGHEGRGLYVWLTEYPEEGSLLLAAAPALTAAPSAQAEPIGTFEGRYVCPEGTREFRGLLADGVEPPKPGTRLYAAPPAAQAEPQEPPQVKFERWLANFDDDEQERLIRYALDHIVPKLKRGIGKQEGK